MLMKEMKMLSDNSPVFYTLNSKSAKEHILGLQLLFQGKGLSVDIRSSGASIWVPFSWERWETILLHFMFQTAHDFRF